MHRSPSIIAILTIVGVGAVTSVTLDGQSRTPWGDPDLQGIWTNDVVTPLERPLALGRRELLTDEELAEAAAANERRQRDTGEPRAGDPILLQGYNQFWIPPRDISRQTSLIVDPPDGRLPPLTAAGRRRADLAFESSQGVSALDASRRRGTDGPEQRSLWERCLTRGLPRLPDFYNNNSLILQTPEHVVIHMEMIHETRVIPLENRPRMRDDVRQWLGDPRGRWEGETLVVDNRSFSDKTNFRGSQSGMHLVERFTRVDDDTIVYEATVEDDSTWTQPWTVRIPLRRTTAPLYEYACHEGNYAMTNTLRGARAEERTPPATR